MNDNVDLPWSASDIAKAIRETAAAAADIRKVARYTADLYDHAKARWAATSLAKLAFAPKGLYQALTKISQGEGSSDDLEYLNIMLNNTTVILEDNINILQNI
jgi:hypothetical protein